MNEQPPILLIEDDAGIAAALEKVLQEEGHQVQRSARGDEGLQRALSESFALVISDLKMPGLTGLELVRQLHQSKPFLPIILMTAFGTTETAIEAMKCGAYDYIVKPFEMEEFLELVDKAVQSGRMMSQPVGIGANQASGDSLVGSSRQMRSIYKEIGRLAPRPVNVLIRGETGTGKELIARALYHHSERNKAPFVAVNCAAIPETLLESELFGHERGAFTGAESRRIGRFEQASGGTIFLDEIGDMPLGTQVKLLRVLEQRTIQRLGGSGPIPVDIRVLAATHRDLEKAIRSNQFREDLFYRLNVVCIQLPPLRERREDIPELIQSMLQKHGNQLAAAAPSIEPSAIELLQAEPWPGNVRELENVIRDLILRSRGFGITLLQAEETLRRRTSVPPADDCSLREWIRRLLLAVERGEAADAYARVLGIAEHELFQQAIERADGNQAKAARWLGISRLTMREKLSRLGLRPQKDGT